MSNSFSPCPYCGDLWLDEQVEERNRNGIGCPNCGPRLLVVKDSLTACHDFNPRDPTAEANATLSAIAEALSLQPNAQDQPRP
jgi:predicted  nucleic acid-binding Zn-ribbon protein